MSRPDRKPAAPPRWLSLWTRLIRDPERREFLAGDLEEEYGRRANRESVAAAQRWYLSQLVRSLLARGPAAGARRGAGGHSGTLPPRGSRTIDMLRADLHDAFRSLRAAPASTLVVAATLALGIGANTAMIGIADAVLFRPLPYADPDRLLWIHAAGPDAADRYEQLSYQDVERLRAADLGLEAVGAYSGAGRTLQVPGVEPLEIDFARVTEGFFEALGARVAPGRRFTRDELRSGAPVIILSRAFWMERLGGNPAIVGNTVDIRGDAHEVVGVAAPEMTFPAGAAFWRPITAEEQADDDRELRVLARMEAGIRLDEVAQRLTVASPELLPPGDEDEGRLTLWAETMRSTLVHGSRAPLLVLLGGAGMVLLIACANVANLLLARAEERRGGLAVRAALGASRGRLVRLQLFEAGLLAGLGGVAGTLCGALLLPLLVRLAPAGTPRIETATVDLRVLAIMIGVMAIAAAGAGALPALSLSAVAPREAMSATGRRLASGPAGRHARAALVAAQIALSTILAVGAVLCLATVGRMASSPPGFEPGGLVTVEMYPSPEAVSARGVGFAYTDLVLEAVRGAPGIVAAGIGSHTPDEGRGFNARLFAIAVPGESGGLPDGAGVVEITPGYLEATGMRLLAGRGVAATDTAAAPRVALLNERFVRSVFGPVAPDAVLGRRLSSVDLRRDLPVEVEIVGVVADVRPDPRVPPNPLVYLPTAQNGIGYGNLVLRHGGDAVSLLPELRARLAAFDASLPLNRMMLTADALGALRASPRFLAQILIAFGGLALALAVLGTYSVVGYGVVRRAPEFGLRRALGAPSGRVVAEVMQREARPIAGGIGVGLLGAAGAARLLESILFGVSGFEPVVYIGIATLVAAGALAAAWLPAQRAAGVDPLVALRGQ
jgi:predicted permease